MGAVRGVTGNDRGTHGDGAPGARRPAPGSRGARRRTPSLLVKFAALSFVLITLLGVVLCAQLSSTIRQRSRVTSEKSARQLVDFVAHLSTSGVSIDAGGTPTVEQALILKRSFDTYSKQGLVAGVDAWLPNGMVAYSDDATVVGQRIAEPAGIRGALIGDGSSEVVRHSANRHLSEVIRDHGPMLVVYAPIRFGNAPVLAAVALYMPYAPVEQGIAQDIRTTMILVVIVLGILYLGLFHLVWQASRRLRRTANLNEELANHDSLTGLPNRSLLQDRVAQALAASARSGRYPSLLLLDLDRFKEINDTLGHHHGDLLLQEVGKRLQRSLRAGDTVARLGGDEFVVLLPDLPSPHSALITAEKLLAELSQPFVLEDVTLDVEGSFGLAVYPDHGDDFSSLLQHADVAMYAAKETHAGVCLYERNQDANSPRRLALLGELRQAIADDDQLLLHYQPKVQVDTGEVTGVEALLRWNHPKHGLLGPMEFIPAAERTGLIRPLTIKVLETALAQVRAWIDEGLPSMRMAVNISTRCLLEVDFAEQVARLLADARVPATLLELEITESTIMTDPEHAMEVLVRLAESGVSLAIDDFGTGYSSLSYLKRLPVHQLKIDRSFVMDMELGASDEAIVRSSVDLARNLGLDVVAEGVETEQTWQQLADLGCDQAQGFFFARPMPAADIPGWLATWGARESASTG
jgi:diguanylate cyclase (GGDEF)-like protein